MYITIKLIDNTIRTYLTIKEATEHSITMSRRESVHPVFIFINLTHADVVQRIWVSLLESLAVGNFIGVNGEEGRIVKLVFEEVDLVRLTNILCASCSPFESGVDQTRRGIEAISEVHA